jgi:HK97 gp10 family phage protein
MAMKGRDRLLRRLAAIQGKPRKAIRAALEKGAEDLTAMQKSLVPKRTGALAASIGYTFGNYAPANSHVRGFGDAAAGDPDLSITIHAGDAKAFYAAFVEYGTAPHPQGGMFKGALHPGTSPQPFFYPPYRTLRRSIKSRVSRAASKAIKDGARV